MAIKKQPFTSSEIILLEGEPRSGKTNTAVAKVVDAYKADKTTRIFANFHLYGVPYMYTPLSELMAYLNSPLLKNGWIIIDESYIGLEARAGMAMINKLLSYLGMQSGKRRLRLIIIAQHGRMIEWRIRWLAHERILCSYDEKTCVITLTIRTKGKSKTRTVRYYAPQYWKYYDTEEIIDVPESSIAKALANTR